MVRIYGILIIVERAGYFLISIFLDSIVSIMFVYPVISLLYFIEITGAYEFQN